MLLVGGLELYGLTFMILGYCCVILTIIIQASGFDSYIKLKIYPLRRVRLATDNLLASENIWGLVAYRNAGALDFGRFHHGFNRWTQNPAHDGLG